MVDAPVSGSVITLQEGNFRSWWAAAAKLSTA